MLLKRAFLLLLILGVLCLNTGCNRLDSNIYNLLAPPRAAGDMSDIQAALNKSINEKYSFKFPTSGEYRSAIILNDLNGDGTEEAVAIYSTTKENTTNMNINLIAKNGEVWYSTGNIKVVATGIEKIEFADLGGDSNKEIIVGWNVYESVDKSVGVYSVTEKGLVGRIFENYTSYLCQDFNADGKDELLTIYKNDDKEQPLATAKLLALNNEGAEEISHCPLDPSATSYKEPVIFGIGDKTAIYIDATKGTDLITEMLVLDDGSLSNLSFSSEVGAGFSTLRPGGAYINDINGDGNYDIPVPFLLTQSENSGSENIYKTNWYCYDGSGITLSLSTIMNYADGYFLEIPEKWDAGISVIANSAERTRTVFRIDPIRGGSAEEIVKIQTLEKSATLNPTFAGSFKLAETENAVYYATLGSYTGSLAVTQEELINLFKLIN